MGAKEEHQGRSDSGAIGIGRAKVLLIPRVEESKNMTADQVSDRFFVDLP